MDQKTWDGTSESVRRCLAVGLSDVQLDACAGALVATELVRVEGVEEACARMSTVLPLAVLHDEHLGADARAALADVAVACGAELVAVPGAPDDALVSRLVEALGDAELRRLSGAS